MLFSYSMGMLSVAVAVVLVQMPAVASFTTSWVRPSPLSHVSSMSTKTTTWRVPRQGHISSYKYQNNKDVVISSTTTTRRSAATSLSLLGAAAALPLSTKLLATCVLPPCLGLYKQEYGVSYAYGTSVALGALWIHLHFMASLKTTTAIAKLVSWHAGALVFYGVRLCLFLALRQGISTRIQEGMERIETRAKERGPRWKRAPFLVFCAGLYYGLVAPLLLTAQLSPAATPKWILTVLQGLVAATWAGFVLGAVGDANKTLIKGWRNNEHHLVTGGVYRWIRHPNYTGEIIGWTANGLIAVAAGLACGLATTANSSGSALLPMSRIVTYALSSVFAAIGLDFVLLQATQGLEKRQQEAYGETEEYKTWIKKSWAGFVFPETAAEVVEEVTEGRVKPELEVSDAEEEKGTGI